MILKFARSIISTLTLLAAWSAYAQISPAAPQITQPVNVSVRQTLTDSVPAQIQRAADQGRVAGSLPMKDMLLRLKPSAAQTAALDKFMEDVQNPNSAGYHHWLTPTEFGAKFGVADQDVQTVTAWLTSNGFQVNEVARGKGWIRFSGTSAQVENAFGTEIHAYQMAGTQRYANATAMSIPAALAPAVAGVLSMNNLSTKAPLHTRLGSVVRGPNGRMVRSSAPSSTGAPVAAVNAGNAALAAQPNFTSQGSTEETFLAPGDFAKIYDTTPLVKAGNDGTGVSIAIVGRSDISLSDVEAFRTVFGLPYNDPTLIYASGDPGVVSGDDEEAILDVEWSGAVAPKANIKYVIGASTYSTDGVDISAAYIVDNAVAPIMSVSFGSCEQQSSQASLNFFHDLWEQAAAEGISVFVSSGDAGSSMCDVPDEYLATPYGLGVSGLASTPFNTAVGGTEFADTTLNTYWSQTVNADQSSVLGYLPEAVWNESCNPNLPVSADNCYFNPNNEGTYAGGGGASNCAVHPANSTPNLLTGLYTCSGGYPKPSWQAGTGVPQDGVRDVPDVALAAAGGHDGFLICYDGSCQWTTGSDGKISLQAASVIGGTSAASPSMAGIMALVEQKNGTLQGLVNYQLYKLATQQGTVSACNSSNEIDPTQSSSCVFHDVTSGSNALSCQFGRTNCTVAISGSFYGVLSGNSATTGYDLASGLGSVDAANLVQAWSKLTTTPTTTALTLSTQTFTHGTAVNVTAVVSPSSGTGTPTGNVALKATGTGIEAGPVVAATLTAGKYAAAVNSLPGGTYTLTAQYAGDANYGSSTSAPVSLTVMPENSVLTTKTLAPSKFFILGQQQITATTSTALGNNFFVQVQVAGASGAGVPTGTVSFSTNGNTYGPFTLDTTGSIYIPCGPFTVCDLPIGTYTFTAKYSGDNSFNPSTTTFPFTITKGKLNFSALLSSQTPPVNSTIIGTVTFNFDPAVVPTGTVTLTRNDTGAVLATGQIGSNGTAVIPFVAAAGDYGVVPSWPGDSNYTAGIALSYEELIPVATGTVNTTTTMAVSSKTATLGGRTQVVITVTPQSVVQGTSGPSGTVTIQTSTGQQAQPVTIVGGQANTYLSWTSAGPVSIYATYNGDSNYNGSGTALTTINVAQATPTLQLQARSNYVAVGSQTSVTASLASALIGGAATSPTGTVQFYDSVGGAAAVPIGAPQPLNAGNGSSLLATLAPVLSAGVNTITAQYSGDANWTPATSGPVMITVTTPDFTASATPNPLTVAAGQTATIAISSQSILGFSSTISVSCGTLPPGMACNTATITPGAAGSITLSTTAPGTTMAKATLWPRLARGVSGTLTLAGLLFFAFPRRKRRLYALSVLAMVGLGAAMAGALVGCGGSSPATATTLVVTSANTKVASGSAVTLEATVTSANSLTGTVTFYDGGTAIGTASTVTNNVATLNTSSLTVGTHAITAKYSGDSHNLASQSSDVLSQTITGQFMLTVNATAGTSSHPITVAATLQ